MTRKGPTKPVPAEYAAARLDNARAFLNTARDALALLEAGQNANPVISLVILASIAYADALTAQVAGEINQKDHAGAVEVLRAALGNRLPNSQDRRFAKLLARKAEAEYGARHGRRGEAQDLLAELENFATWIEQEMVR